MRKKMITRSDKPIITSLLENDLYKLMMLYAFWRRQVLNTDVVDTGVYEFQCRNMPQILLSRVIPRLMEEYQNLCSLSYTDADLTYVDSLGLFEDRRFFTFLRSFKYDMAHIDVEKVEGSRENRRDLRIQARGPIPLGMGFEIPTLFLVNEIYFDELARDHGVDRDKAVKEYRKDLRIRCDMAEHRAHDLYTGAPRPLCFADFGLRRRFSKRVQEAGIQFLLDNPHLPVRITGTSNMDAARKFNIKPAGSGTAHEWYQAFQAFYRKDLRNHQKHALDFWLECFPDKPFYPLTDTVTTPVFLRDLDFNTATKLTGFRQDSGSPIGWTKLVHRRLYELGIPVTDKKYIYSNSLDFNGAFDILDELGPRCDALPAIGTYFTNCMPYPEFTPPLNIVMKLVECNGLPVAKVSDDKGKVMCRDPQYLNMLTTTFDIER